MNVSNDLRHIWNVISNAWSKSSHPPTSPDSAPATKSGSSRFQRQLPEVLPPIERRFEDNPRIIRGYPKIKSSSRTRRFGDLPGAILETILYCKIQHFALRLSPKMSRSAAPATKSHPPTSPNTAPATQNRCHQRSACYLTELLLGTLLNCDSTELWLNWTVTLTELWLNWTVTLLNCDFSERSLSMSSTIRLLLDWTVTW